MSVIVTVTGSSTETRFAVTNMSVPTAPTTVHITAPFENGGCVVDCSGKLAAVGNYGGGSVAIYDLFHPAEPVLQETLSTGLQLRGLTGIGALSFDGTNLLVGEANGPNIVLIDIKSKKIVSSEVFKEFADGGVADIALVGKTAVVTGTFSFGVLNLARPTALTLTPYHLPTNAVGTPATGPFACGFDGSTAVIGDAHGNLNVYAIMQGWNAEYLGETGSSLPSVTSLATLGIGGGVQRIAAASVLSADVSLIVFQSGPTSPYDPPFQRLQRVGDPAHADPGGAVKFLGLPELVASSNHGGVAYLNANQLFEPQIPPHSGTPVLGASAHGHLNASLRPTLGFTAFDPPPPR